MKRRVAVVGAGVSGLTSAIALGERGYEPVIFAHELPPATTSAVAAAIWIPYDAEPEPLVTAWALVTFGRLLELARDRDRTGVSLIEFRIAGDAPSWAEAIGYRLLDDGYVITVPLMETPVYLPYLQQRVTDLGGSFHQIPALHNLDELPPDFDLIVNCSGYGARSLVADDEVKPHRGQVVVVPKVDRTWAMVDGDPLTYVIPRRHDCVLGGVNIESESREVDPEATASILSRCNLGPISPITSLVGIRPYRESGVRLEPGITAKGRPVIHNYGHGGCGFTVSWGCAEKVVELAKS